MYLTYAEYQNMGGTLDEAAFADLEFEARSYVNWVTFNRLKNETVIPEDVKECMYHLIKLINTKMSAMNVPVGENDEGQVSTIASQSNDGVSVSYNILSARDIIETSNKEVDDVIRRCLSSVTNSLGHRLLYRGLYHDE